MTPQEDMRFLITRARMAWALHEWNELLHQATTSVYADRYQDAAATIVRSLDGVKTMHDLAQVFFSPEPQFKTQVLSLCLDGEIFLFPHVLLGISCALRLRRLLEQAAATDSV